MYILYVIMSHIKNYIYNIVFRMLMQENIETQIRAGAYETLTIVFYMRY